MASDVYRLLAAPDLDTVAAKITDPGLLHVEAKNFIEHGTELARRRGGSALERSIACLRYAVELQPDSSAAHAGLARAFCYQAAYNASREPLRAGLEHARRAVELNPANADAHVTLAGALDQTGKIANAIEASLVALEYAPTSRMAANLLSNTYKTLARPDNALAWVEAARLADGSDAASEAGFADSYMHLDPQFDSSRSDPVYLRLVEQMTERVQSLRAGVKVQRGALVTCVTG